MKSKNDCRNFVFDSVLKKIPVFVLFLISIMVLTGCESKEEKSEVKSEVEQVLEAYYLARELGFDNINMDIILGLPGEEREDVIHTMEKIKELDPDNLTVHSLAVKRAARLTGWIDENGMKDLKNSDEVMEVAVAGAREMGMEPYYLYRQKNISGNLENVGFGKPGKNGIYNILIMEEMQTIVAVGAGTVTKRVFPEGRIERTDTVKDVELYISRIDEMIQRKKNLFSL